MVARRGSLTRAAACTAATTRAGTRPARGSRWVVTGRQSSSAVAFHTEDAELPLAALTRSSSLNRPPSQIVPPATPVSATTVTAASRVFQQEVTCPVFAGHTGHVRALPRSGPPRDPNNALDLRKQRQIKK